VLGDPVVWGLGDRALLTLSAGAAAAAIPLLERFVIADDVTFSDRTPAHACLALCGPAAPDGLARVLGSDPPPAGRFVRASLAGGEALVLRRDLGDRPAFEAVVERDRLGASADALGKAGAVPVGTDAWDVARVETGTPEHGAELDDRVLPNEAGLDDAISWTKGCYLGQEPVVMAHHRGHPPSLLCRLSIDGSPPARDTELLEDGRRAGRLTTAVPHPSGAGSLALGFVRWDSARDGAVLALPSGARATVSSVLARR
jgi:folate-binding protein YgfZ